MREKKEGKIKKKSRRREEIVKEKIEKKREKIGMK